MGCFLSHKSTDKKNKFGIRLVNKKYLSIFVHYFTNKYESYNNHADNNCARYLDAGEKYYR
jgi:hypothetical protein